MGEIKSGNSTDLLSNAWEAAAKLGDIQLDICDKLSQTQNDLVGLWTEYGTRQLQIFDGYHQPAECAEMESALITEYSPKVFEKTVKIFNIFTEATNDLMTQLSRQLVTAPAANNGHAKKIRKVVKISKTAAAA